MISFTSSPLIPVWVFLHLWSFCSASLLFSVTSPLLHSSHLPSMKISLSSLRTSFLPASLHISSRTSFDHLPALSLCMIPLSNPSSWGAYLAEPPHLNWAPSYRLAHSLPLPLLLSMLVYFSSTADTHTDKLIFSLPLSQLWASVPQGLFEPKAYLSV